MGVLTNRLLAFARELQRATTFDELLEITRSEADVAVGYANVWLFVSDTEDVSEVRLISIAGDKRASAWEHAPVLTIAGDAMLEEIVASEMPVVVEDARIDPRTNKDLVAKIGNRTIINIPLRMLDKPFGAFGLGTFGDEGCRAPTPEQLDYLVAMASQLVVAAARLRFQEERARAERERHALEQRLYQMQRLESIAVLAGGVAHDFNNLLTVVMGGVGLARRDGASESLDMIIEAAERGRALTRQLLAMGRAQTLALRAIEINDHVAALAKLLRRLLPENIQIDVIPGSRLPPVRADAAQLDQVLMNLCINARDAMPAGGRLTIETEHVVVNGAFVASHPWASPGRYVLTTVTDTGTGIASDVREHLFEPFHTTKNPTSGSGLGLAVSYGIVRQHGGLLHCYSEVGVGTSFKVYLPVDSRRASEVGTKLAGPVPRGTETILLAEDDDAVRTVAVRALQDAGYVVEAVKNGLEAVHRASEREFALFVFDAVMPELSGPDAIERIRVLRPTARFIVVSGYAPSSVATTLSNLDSVDLLAKPYAPDDLLRAVRRVLDGGEDAGPRRLDHDA